jgi:hypothetical protein
MLRQACRDEKIRSLKAPYEGQGEEQSQLPFEFWTRVAPREWREREVDYDGPDQHGCPIQVMLNEADFDYWKKHLQPSNHPPQLKRSAPQRDFAHKAILAIWNGTPPKDASNPEVIRQVTEWIANECKRLSMRQRNMSPDTILRAAGRKK